MTSRIVYFERDGEFDNLVGIYPICQGENNCADRGMVEVGWEKESE